MIKKAPQPSLADLLLALRRKINESTKKDPLKHELSASQLEVLWFIGPLGKKSMESIAEYLNIAPPSATSMIERMEKKGLIVRERDTEDRRVIHILLSQKTKKQLSSIWKQKEKILNRIVSKLSLKDRRDLERVITILVQK